MGGRSRRDPRRSRRAGRWIGDLLHAWHRPLRSAAGCPDAGLARPQETAYRNRPPERANSWPAANPPNCAPKRRRWAFRCTAWCATCAIPSWPIVESARWPGSVKSPSRPAGPAWPPTLADRAGSGGERLPVVLGRKPGDGGAESRAARPGLRPAPAGRPGGGDPGGGRSRIEIAGSRAWSNFTPAFAMASARHETQYSRLIQIVKT